MITEPVLQPLSGEMLLPCSAITDDNARSDIKVDGFWGCRQQSSFFDIKIFNPIQHPPIVQRLCHHVIAAKRTVNEENTKIELPVLSMVLSLR